MSEGPKVKGHLIITVAEASGKNKDDQLVWDPNFVEGFVKGALKRLVENAYFKGVSCTNPDITHWCAVEIRGEKGLKVKVRGLFSLLCSLLYGSRSNAV